MYSLRLFTILAVVTISLSNAINVWNIENTTCEYDEDVLCTNNSTCAVLLNQYLTDCGVIFNETYYNNHNYSGNYCPSQCQSSFNAYIEYVYPDKNSTNICQCETDMCRLRTQILIDLRCIAMDCNRFYEMCQNDVNCKPIYQAFNESCYQVYTPLNDDPQWQYNFCPIDCKANLQAYVEYVAPNHTSYRYCDCNNDIECEFRKYNLEKAGCVLPICHNQYIDCLRDPFCFPFAQNYTNVCYNNFFNVGTIFPWDEAYCPIGCEDAFKKYINSVSPPTGAGGGINFCDCPPDDILCEMGKDEKIRHGCIENNCKQYWMECKSDIDYCAPIADNYIQQCEMIINGTWKEDYCPIECKQALTQYINAVVNFSYPSPVNFCDCFGDEECIFEKNNLISANCLLQDCIYLHNTQCIGNTNTNCDAVFNQYVGECLNVFMGVDQICPINCTLRLQEYLSLITDIPPFGEMTDICTCEKGSDCLGSAYKLNAAKCLPPRPVPTDNPTAHPIATTTLSPTNTPFVDASCTCTLTIKFAIIFIIVINIM
eukprot:359897_1